MEKMTTEQKKTACIDRMASKHALSAQSTAALRALPLKALLQLERELKASDDKSFQEGQNEAKMRQQMGPSQWPS